MMKLRTYYLYFAIYIFLISIIPFSHCHADGITHLEADPPTVFAITPTHSDQQDLAAEPTECCGFEGAQEDHHFHFIVEKTYSSLRQCQIEAHLSGAVRFVSILFLIADGVSLSQGFPENREDPPILRERICSKRQSGLSPPLF